MMTTNENTAAGAAINRSSRSNSSVYSPPPNDEDADDAMKSILAAAIGLTSLYGSSPCSSSGPRKESVKIDKEAVEKLAPMPGFAAAAADNEQPEVGVGTKRIMAERRSPARKRKESMDHGWPADNNNSSRYPSSYRPLFLDGMRGAAAMSPMSQAAAQDRGGFQMMNRAQQQQPSSFMSETAIRHRQFAPQDMLFNNNNYNNSYRGRSNSSASEIMMNLNPISPERIGNHLSLPGKRQKIHQHQHQHSWANNSNNNNNTPSLPPLFENSGLGPLDMQMQQGGRVTLPDQESQLPLPQDVHASNMHPLGGRQLDLDRASRPPQDNINIASSSNNPILRPPSTSEQQDFSSSGMVARPSADSITLNFPEILYEIVSDPTNANVLSWLPHGRGFAIRDKTIFASRILPRHFDGAKFTSFTRRLKRWNFERVSRGPEMGAYYNKFFVRGRPDLVPSMMYGVDGGEESEQQKIMMEEGERSAQNEENNIRKTSMANNDEVRMMEEGERKDSNGEIMRMRKKSLDLDMSSVTSDVSSRFPIKTEEDLLHDDRLVAEAAMMASQQQQQQKQQAEDNSVAKRMISRDNDDAVNMEAAMEVQRQRRELELLELRCRENNAAASSEGRAARDKAIVEAAAELQRQKQERELRDFRAKEAAATEVHRRKRRELDELRAKQQEHLRGQLSEQRSGGGGGFSQRDAAERMSRGQRHRAEPGMVLGFRPPSRQGSASPGKHCIPTATPYDPLDYTQMYMNRQNQAQPFGQMKGPVGGDVGRNFHQQQQQPKSEQQPHPQHVQQNQSSKDKQKQPYKMPPNGALHTSTPGYKPQTRKKKDKPHHENPPEQQQKQSGQQLQRPRSGSRQVSGATESLEKQPQEKISSSGHGQVQPQSMQYNPEDYMSMARARRNMAEMEARIMARRNGSIPAGSSAMTDMEMLRMQQLNLISPQDNNEQQLKCLNDIERQVLAEMSYPALPSATANGNANNSYNRGSNSGDAHRRTTQSSSYGSSVNDAASADREGVFADSHMQMNNSRFLANQGMIQKILTSSKTHEEIMMMAARDLQSRSGGGAPAGVAAAELAQRPPPPSPGRFQQRMQQSQREVPRHQQVQRPLSHQQQLSQQRLDDEEMLMMAAQRDLEARVQQQQQYRQHSSQNHQSPSQPRRQMMVPTNNPHQPRRPHQLHQEPMSPESARYHTMLRELEEKVDRETVLADAAAAQAAASAAGLRDSMSEAQEYDANSMKRRNSRASAA